MEINFEVNDVSYRALGIHDLAVVGVSNETNNAIFLTKGADGKESCNFINAFEVVTMAFVMADIVKVEETYAKSCID